jgi:hypothetical protein
MISALVMASNKDFQVIARITVSVGVAFCRFAIRPVIDMNLVHQPHISSKRVNSAVALSLTFSSSAPMGITYSKFLLKTSDVWDECRKS